MDTTSTYKSTYAVSISCLIAIVVVVSIWFLLARKINPHDHPIVSFLVGVSILAVILAPTICSLVAFSSAAFPVRIKWLARAAGGCLLAAAYAGHVALDYRRFHLIGELYYLSIFWAPQIVIACVIGSMLKHAHDEALLK